MKNVNRKIEHLKLRSSKKMKKYSGAGSVVGCTLYVCGEAASEGTTWETGSSNGVELVVPPVANVGEPVVQSSREGELGWQSDLIFVIFSSQM